MNAQLNESIDQATGEILAPEDSIGTELLKKLHIQVTHLKKPWHQTPEQEQDRLLDHLRVSVQEAMAQAVQRLAAQRFKFIRAQIESLTIKDGAKATIIVSRGGSELHQLSDHVGSVAMLVFADEAEYVDGMHTVKAEADQRVLELEEEAAAQALE